MVRAPARRYLRGAGSHRGRAADRCPARETTGRPLHAHALAAHRPFRRSRRRRRDVHDARARVRESRRALLDRLRRVRTGIPQGHSRRRRRPALLGLGHFADRASAQSARAGRTHEHPSCRHQQGLVRRRRRLDAGARPAAHANRSRHARLPCRHASGLRRASERCALREIQEVVRRLFPSQAPQRAARHRRHLLRLPGERLG